jgi:1-acyl-sn-glycerol-3-phosphate acyltransferase
MASRKYEYVNAANWLFLTSLRWWARITALFFFRRFVVAGQENIPQDVPVLFVVNHQSAFMDPVLIGISCGRKPWYLTRAGAFANNLVRYLLRSIHMLPVFRLMDNVDIRQANEPIFEECSMILQDGGSVLIFPEGNHGMLKRLRTPLRKGFARIALHAEFASDFTLGLKIVPVGITYEHPTKFRTDVLVWYGEPFTVESFGEVYKIRPSEAITRLTRMVEKEMQKYMIHIQEEVDYDHVEYEWVQQRWKDPDLMLRLKADQKYLASQGTSSSAEGIATSEENSKMLIAAKILGFPVFVVGFILNAPIYFISKLLLRQTIRDPHFNQSFKFVIGMSLVPLVTIFQGILLAPYLTISVWVYCLTVPLLGILAYDYYDILLKPRGYQKTSVLMKSN